jgi:hypothetical protein
MVTQLASCSNRLPSPFLPIGKGCLLTLFKISNTQQVFFTIWSSHIAWHWPMKSKKPENYWGILGSHYSPMRGDSKRGHFHPFLSVVLWGSAWNGSNPLWREAWGWKTPQEDGRLEGKSLALTELLNQPWRHPISEHPVICAPNRLFKGSWELCCLQHKHLNYGLDCVPQRIL